MKVTKIIDKVKSKLKPAKEPTYKERLESFSKEYKKLSLKYRIDFTMLPIDLDTVYQENGVNKIKDSDAKK